MNNKSGGIVVIILLLVFATACTNARICNTVDIRNTVESLSESLTNCTIVVGYVRIVLFEDKTEQDFHNITFPDLTEITGHLIFYRVRGLTSLGKLFPNLRVIRGFDLFMDYALVIYDMPDLIEIGLYSLVGIVRGLTRIEKSDAICYVDTVDFQVLGNGNTGNVHYFPTPRNSNKPKCVDKCSSNCTGHCWDAEHCQTINYNCDEVCLGCRGPGPKNCLGCKYLNDDGKCVKECPKEKYTYFSLCVTKQFCEDIKKSEWFIFKGQCLNECPLNYTKVTKDEGTCKYCGDHCIKYCPDGYVNNMDSAQKLRGCTHIKGYLQIKLESKILIDELEENLGRIEEIDGYLKVFRSVSLRNLTILKNLKRINGNKLDKNSYALVVYDNPNLQKLWDWNNFTLEIGNGTFSFHYNPQLCLSEIEKLFEVSGLPKNFSIIEVSTLSNGDKLSCSYKPLYASVVEYFSNNVTIRWGTYAVDSDHELVGYGLYYIEAPGNTTVSFYDGLDVCDDSGWNTVVVSNLNNTNDYVERRIDDLKPSTRYAYYVKTYISALNKHKYRSSIEAQSNMQYFTTYSGDPSIPEQVRAFATGSNTIKLTWDKPQRINGELSHYVITGYLILENHTFIGQRNYCRNPHREQKEEQQIEATTEMWKNQTDNAATSNSTNSCMCKKPNIDVITLEDFDAICEDLDKQKTRSSNYHGCGNYAYHVIDIPSINNNKNDIVVHKRADGSLTTKKPEPLQGSFIEEMVDATLTSYEIKNLKHFSIYFILITACNQNRTEIQQCSSVVQVSQRTGRKEKADSVGDFYIEVANTYNAHIKWQEPSAPNGMIVSYQIEYQRVGVENSKSHVDCVTSDEHRRAGNVYTIKVLPPGTYSVRVRSTSLAGFGVYTNYKTFEIVMPSSGAWTAVWVSLLLGTVAVGTVIFVFYLRWRRKNILDNLFLITSINPDYAGHIYIEDEWEIDRNDIQLGNEIGQGSFGMVYNGHLRSQDLPCAVKTVNEPANSNERMEFLNEACVMKAFNDAHHVVRLLGVVSRGQPPLVVMELMARGDLKSFLRSCRDSSNCLTCAEMYRMAAEIADGMAYLAAKKFVHRDLAARNCMVSADHTVKVGDFGMTRDIYETDYYRKETKGLLPVRWMSPESLADGVFTSDADVWSYGIVLWEMATLAEQPYQGLSNEQVLQFVIARGTLQRPPQCPDLLYEIMEACWKWRPMSRPAFTDIVPKLENHVGQDFRLISFYHSREGEEHRMNAVRKRVQYPPSVSSPEEPAVHWHNSDEDVSFLTDDLTRPLALSSLERPEPPRLSSSGMSYQFGSSSTNGYKSYPHSSK